MVLVMWVLGQVKRRIDTFGIYVANVYARSPDIQRLRDFQ